MDGLLKDRGNYEAFARPRKPAGVDDKTAWFVGAGLSSLSGAAFLILEPHFPRMTLDPRDRGEPGAHPAPARARPH